ncbi:MAG: SRPBCC domain-containing protein [Methylacidiphilales bacterium]|nr:SRPBCC domain-containing protein [Candidatus Methylacidiphilales bacterium]
MTATKNNPAETPADRTLVITRVFDAPRSLVYEAWTKKEHLDRWCAPHGFTIPESRGDFRIGGKWYSLMIAPDGEKYPVGGVYREIVPNERLVFTHTWEEDDATPEHETLVTIRFADEGAKTRVTFEQSIFRSVESRNNHESGWSQCFEKLETLLAELKTKGKA